MTPHLNGRILLWNQPLLARLLDLPSVGQMDLSSEAAVVVAEIVASAPQPVAGRNVFPLVPNLWVEFDTPTLDGVPTLGTLLQCSTARARVGVFSRTTGVEPDGIHPIFVLDTGTNVGAPRWTDEILPPACAVAYDVFQFSESFQGNALVPDRALTLLGRFYGFLDSMGRPTAMTTVEGPNGEETSILALWRLATYFGAISARLDGPTPRATPLVTEPSLRDNRPNRRGREPRNLQQALRARSTRNRAICPPRARGALYAKIDH